MGRKKTAGQKQGKQAGLTRSQLKALERTIPDKHHRESFFRLIGQLDADVAAMTLLKGHLVLEEKITASIEKFVFDAEALENARLRRNQGSLWVRVNPERLRQGIGIALMKQAFHERKVAMGS